MDIFLREAPAGMLDIFLRNPLLADAAEPAVVAEEEPGRWWGPWTPVQAPVAAYVLLCEPGAFSLTGQDAILSIAARERQMALAQDDVVRAELSLRKLHEREFLELLLLDAA